jgi:hypothetical protein
MICRGLTYPVGEPARCLVLPIFILEFMLSETLPIYSDGLGNVAGDQLKATSDLGVPAVGVRLKKESQRMAGRFAMAGKWPKRLVFIGIGLVLLLVLPAGGGMLYLRSEAGRAWMVSLLRQEVHQSLDAELTVTKVRGDPLFGLELHGVSLKKDGQVFFQTDSLEASLSLAGALGKVPHLEKIVLVAPRLVLPLPAFPERSGSAGGLSIGTIEARAISLQRAASKDSPALSLEGGRVVISGLRLGGGANGAQGLAALNYEAQTWVESLSWGQLGISQITAHVKSGQGRVEIEPLSLSLLGSSGQGRLWLDARARPEVGLNLLLPSLDISQALAQAGAEERVQGRVRVQVDLTSRGEDPAQLQKNLSGSLLITGNNLVFKGNELDNALDRYEEGTSIGLFDVGSFFLLGPLGPLILKTLQTGRTALAATGGSTPIGRVRAEWRLSHGLMIARDVAFSSARHRVAVKGAIDLNTWQFKDLVLAVVDSEGCALHTQKVTGSLENPQIGTTQAAAMGISRPFVSLYNAITMPMRPPCRPFYEGKVPHPT